MCRLLLLLSLLAALITPLSGTAIAAPGAPAAPAPAPAPGPAPAPAPAAAEPVAGPAWDVAQSAQCLRAIADAEQRHGLPKNLLLTIAKVESGRPITAMGDIRPWPWTINADGAGYFFQSRAAAVAWAGLALGRNVRYMDVGCTQVDWELHPTAFASIDQGFDPAANADYAARYLRQLYEGSGRNWFLAVGLYHSHTPDLAADYRDRVSAIGRGILLGARGGPEPLYRRALRQGTLRLALSSGRTLVLHLGRQPSRRGNRLSACAVAAILNPILASPARVRPCGRT